MKIEIVPINDLFEVVYGVNLELNKLEQSSDGINFVSRTSTNNGVSAKVNIIEGVKPQPPGTISVSGGGSPCEAFVQLEEYYSGRDLYVLYPKEKFSTEVLTFYCTCIRMNKFRFNYGRQTNRTLPNLLVPIHTSYNDWIEESAFTKKNEVKNKIKNVEDFIFS
jgi:hypothetical protein